MFNQNRKQPVYLLNTAILTAYGDWRFEGPLPVERVRDVLADGFVSAVGHAGSAKFLSRLLKLNVAVNRISIEMKPNEQAVVLRLMQRLPAGEILSDEQLQSLPFELGLLTRLA